MIISLASFTFFTVCLTVVWNVLCSKFISQMALVCFFFVAAYMTQLPCLNSFEYVELGICFYLGVQIYVREWLFSIL